MNMAIKINEYVELMGVIAYLGNNGLCKNMSPYIEDIDKWFLPYKKHSIIRKVKALIQRNTDINIWISLGFFLKYQKHTFVLPKDVTGSWSVIQKSKILELLTNFYESTQFHSFFTKHKAFYDEICRDYQKFCQPLNFDWFRNFYGFDRADDFLITPLPVLEGFCCHSRFVMCDKKDILYQLIYECHYAFMSSLSDISAKKQSALEPSAQALFEISAWAMKQQGYDDWQAMIREYLVRAATNVYMQENGFTKQEIRQDIIANFSRGFYIMPELVGYFNKYRYCRDRFKTFNDFYSEIVNFFANHTQREVKRIDEIANTILEV